MPVRERFPTSADVIASRPDDLGPEIILDLQKRHNTLFSPTSFPHELARHYKLDRATEEFMCAVREAIEWARRDLLLVQHHNAEPPSDALMLSRRGRRFIRDDIERLRLERILPDFLLHDRIRQACIDIFSTGRYQAAVFEAFRELEIAIREAAGYTAEKHGMPMVQDAFNASKGGPLVDLTSPPGERESLQLLMAGAVGHFKNPRSHRNLELDNPREAAEMLIVASHLLRIVDARSTGR